MNEIRGFTRKFVLAAVRPLDDLYFSVERVSLTMRRYTFTQYCTQESFNQIVLSFLIDVNGLISNVTKCFNVFFEVFSIYAVSRQRLSFCWCDCIRIVVMGGSMRQAPLINDSKSLT